MRHAKKTLMALLFFPCGLGLPEILLLPHLQHRKTLCPAKSLLFIALTGREK